MKYALVLFLTLMSFGSHANGVFARPAVNDSRVFLWPEIPIVRGADLHNYNQATSISRLELMQELVGFMTQLLEASESSKNPDKEKDLLNAIMTFDQLYDRHKQIGKDGMEEFIENGIRSSLDQLYRQDMIQDRSIRFVQNQEMSTLKGMSSGSHYSGSITGPFLNQAAFMYGSYTVPSIGSGFLTITVTLVRVSDGMTENFSATAFADDAPMAIARKIFQFFEEEKQFQRHQNPNPGLKWIKPTLRSGDQARYGVTRDVALRFCQAQGGRLPTVDEIQVASLTNLSQGGIVLKTASYYHVAVSKTSQTSKLFLNTSDNCHNYTGGCVSSGVGRGNNPKALFYCAVDQ